jgi:hypothetical protein
VRASLQQAGKTKKKEQPPFPFVAPTPSVDRNPIFNNNLPVGKFPGFFEQREHSDNSSDNLYTSSLGT